MRRFESPPMAGGQPLFLWIHRAIVISGKWTSLAALKLALRLTDADSWRFGHPMGSGLPTIPPMLPISSKGFASGAGQEEMVLQSKYPVYINDWSPDGRYLMYTETSPESQNDLWLLPTSG